VALAFGAVPGSTILDDAKLSYFLSTIELRPGTTHGMSRWRKRLFLATARLTADAAEYIHLPRERTVIMGSASSSGRGPLRGP
jgi:KUP system potassium uptake protein